MHARVRISACLALCVSAATHTHTRTYPVRLYVVSVSVSLLPQHLPLPSTLLYNICILTQLGPIVILFGRLTASWSAPAVVYNMSGHRCRTGMYNVIVYVSLSHSLSLCVCVLPL